MTGKPLLAAGATLLCAVALTACGTAAGGTSGGSTAKPSSASSGATVDPNASTSAPKPSQTITHKPAFGGTDAELEIYSLKKSGDLVVLEFGIKAGNDPASANFALSRDESDDDVSGVYLLDTKNKKKYFPAKFGDECLCSSGLYQHGVNKSQTQYLYATYGAPEGVTSVDISVPRVGSFKNIPIS